MFKYKNETCTGCGQKMQEGEDIVVCPECATPQHRECYNKLGGCVNAYLHASGYVWQPEAPEEPEPDAAGSHAPTSPCPFCGTSNPGGALHCSSCGSPLTGGRSSGEGTDAPRAGAPFPGFNPFSFVGGGNSVLPGTEFHESDPIGDTTAGELAVYVKRNYARFLPIFRNFSENPGKKTGWNWCAFLFAPYYFFYRRMLKYGAILAGILLGLSLLAAPSIEASFSEFRDYGQSVSVQEEIMDDEQAEEFLQESQALMRKGIASLVKNPLVIITEILTLLCHVAAGLFADRLYYGKALADIKALKEHYPDEQVSRSLLFRIGGTSVLNGICGFFAIDAITTLLTMLAEQFVK